MTRVYNQEIYYKLNGIIMAETAAAIKFRIKGIEGKLWAEDNFQTEWFPLSQVKSITRSQNNSPDLDSIEVKDWILKTKGFA